MIKRILLLFLLFASILSQKALAISIVLDGTQTLLSGHQCKTVKYRFGTQSSYQNQPIDIILQVTAKDNEYNNGKCVDIVDNVIGFRLRDKDKNNDRSYIDMKVTVVKKGTLTPIRVDSINVTNFDLDNNPNKTETDDVYYKNPTKVYLSKFTNVTQSSGNFFSKYTTKLKGQTTGNCDDSATLLQKECRGGVSFENTSSFYARVQNDNAYGTLTYSDDGYNYNYRLIQFSFELKDLTPLMSEVEVPCGTVNYSISNDSWIEGTGHNGYINNLDISKTVQVTDAQNLKVTINGETEHNFDWIYIYDENNNKIYVGSGHFNNKIVNISGSKVTIKFTSDGSVTKSGATVKIEGIGCEEEKEPTISIEESVEVEEGDSGDRELIFTVNLDTPAPNGGVNVQIDPTNITANEGEDYSRGTGSLYFAQGESQKTVIYKIHGDTKVENNETFRVQLHNPQHAKLDENHKTAIGTIVNDDKDIFVSIQSDVEIREGDSGTKSLEFTILLNEPAPRGGISVQIQPHNITANEGEDYHRNGSSIHFAEGEREKSVSYSINGDNKIEDDETFSVEIHNPQHAKLDNSKKTAIATILNDDGNSECDEIEKTIEVRVSATNDDAEESQSGSVYKNSSDLELVKDRHNQTIGIRFREIYIPKDATITKAYIQFSVDETSSESTHLNIYGEDHDNPSEFSFHSHNISQRVKTSAHISWSPQAWNKKHEQGLKQRTPNLQTIIQEIVNREGWKSGNAISFIITGSGKRVAEAYDGDSDEAPLLHIEYSSCKEEESNNNSTATCYALTDNSNKLYKVSMLPNGNPLPTPSITNISRTFNGEGSAYRASDNKFYAFKGNSDDHGPSDLYTIDIDTGATTKIVDNIISGAVDGAEFYFDPTLNREILYILSGEYNSKLYAFDPTDWSALNGYPKNTNTDLSSLAIDPLSGEAYAIDDYNYDNKKPKVYKLNLKTGSTTHITTLQNLADAEGLAFASDGNLYIEDEGRDDLNGKRLYRVDLATGALTPSAITNANGDIEGLSCNGTQMAIAYPSISIATNPSIIEGDSGDKELLFNIILSKSAPVDITFNYSLNNQTATRGSDYQEGAVPSSQTITIPKDSNATTIAVTIYGDNEVEDNETFTLALTNIEHAIFDAETVISTGTIVNDDKEPLISIANDVNITEGDSGDKELIFTVNLDTPAPNGGVAVQIDPQNITANEGEDYAREITSLHFIEGESQKTVIYKIHGDTKVEDNETFNVTLHNPQHAKLDESHKSAIGTIINDDKEIFISIADDVNITEGDSGTKSLDFTILLNEPAPIGGVTVQIQPHNITANEGEDYNRVSSSISFAEGEQEKIISYNINGDTKIEDNETFSVELHNPQHAQLDEDNKTAIATIINDDREVTPHLVANYTFDACLWRGNQNEVKDSSSNGYHGQAIGGATTQKEHKINRSAIFKSTNHQYVTIDGFDDIFGVENNEFTFTAWVKPNTLTSAKTNHNTQNTIFAKASDPYNDNIEIGINENGTLHLYLDTDRKDTFHNFGESGDIDTNGWHFIAVSYKDGVAEVTIDNKHYSDTTTWSGANHIDQALHSPVTIGASIHVDNFFNGAIDEVKLFSTALNNNQLLRILNNEEQGKNWNGTDRDSVEEVCAVAPTGCITTAFMFQGRTDVFALNLANGDMPPVQSEPINIQNINAVGFNKKDGFFWGYNYDKKDGTIAKIGMLQNGIWSTEEIKIEGLEGFASYVGDVDSSSHLYLKGTGSSRSVVVIDLDPDSSTYLTKIREFNLDFDLNTADWAFNPKDNMLYAVNNGGGTKYLYKIDPSNGHQISKSNTLLTGNRGFGAGFFDANGFYYVYDNSTGEIFRIDISNNSSKAVLFSTTNIVSLNDGAMCTDAEFKFDFGDLPENYPTLLESDGARHSLPTYGEPTLYLGNGVSHEDNGKPSTNASLDTDDDGVKLNGGSLQDKTIDAGATTTVKVTTHGEGYLTAWIDWNSDGDFSDELEQVATNIEGSSGLITLHITAPSRATDIVTYARFRYSSQKDLTPTGNALDGEVEDYKITIHGNLEPFSCNQTLYLSNRTELGTGSGDSGATWLHSFYAMTPVYTPIGRGFASDNGGYNAMGYNVKDNFIYALYGNQLLKIDKNANVKNLGAVQGLPNTQLYAGEFDREGNYYVTGNGGADNTMYKIDIAQKRVIETITLSSSVRFWDMAVDKSGDYFYAMLIEDGDSDSDYNNGHFAKIEISTGEITPLGERHRDESSYISLIFSDAHEKIIAVANDDGMYEINPQTGMMYRINTTPTLSYYNDGTSCPDASFILPPHTPRLSIGDVTKAEGDSGETTFEFEVSIDADLPIMPMGMPVMFFYKVIDGEGNDITRNALESDHDFQGGSGIGMNMNIFSNNRSQTISVPVYGDEKVEKDEVFYVEIYFPDFFPTNLVMMGRDRGMGTILNDDMKFKIVRTNAESGDNSLYTQIAGRDFDYAIVSDGDINIDQMTLKIELVDNNNSTDNILYKGYRYIESGSRADIINSSDLAILKATKDASFRVSFLKDENGTIAHGDYATEEDFNSMANRVGYTQVAQESSDHFAIRPMGYNIKIEDIDKDNKIVTYRDSSYSGTQPLNLLSGYGYKIDAQAVAYDTNHSTVIGYTNSQANEINATLIFNDKSSCFDNNNSRLEDYKFSNGQLQETINHNNVGKYLLTITDSSWSDIDKNSSGCIPNSSEISNSSNEKSGCDISTEGHEISIKFNPYTFNISNTQFYNSNQDSRDYLYMNNLNQSTKMAVQIHSTIIAEGFNGHQLSNFTQSCVAEESLLSLNFTPTFKANYSNNNGEIEITTQKGSQVYPQQLVTFNNSGGEVTYFKDIAVKSDYFLDENEGNLTLDILYNMEKNVHEETNPIKVLFQQFELNTTNSKAWLKGEEVSPTQKENSGVINQTRTFFYARIRSDREVYPETAKTMMHTPLMVEIYCKVTQNDNWCNQEMNIKNISVDSYESYQGWYVDQYHDSSIDGNVSELISSNNDFTISPTTIPSFKKGRIDDVYVSYNSSVPDTLTTTKIDIITQPWLRYNRDTSTDGTPKFILRIKDISAMTGIGAGGNQAEITKKLEPNGKIDW